MNVSESTAAQNGFVTTAQVLVANSKQRAHPVKESRFPRLDYSYCGEFRQKERNTKLQIGGEDDDDLPSSKRLFMAKYNLTNNITIPVSRKLQVRDFLK